MVEILAKGAEGHGVRSRFDDCNDALAAHVIPKALECRTNGRGMMSKIVVTTKPIFLRKELQPPFDTFKPAQRFDGNVGGNARMASRGNSSQCVIDVVHTE